METKTKKKTVKRKIPTVVTVKLEIGSNGEHLYHTSMATFIGEQSSRFSLVEGKRTTEGTLHWCNSYLEAQVLRAFIKANSDVETGLFYDERNEEWVVASPLKFRFGR